MDPNDVDSIPRGLMDTLWESAQGTLPGNEATRLRHQMRADALQPVTSPEDDHASYGSETNKEAQHESFSAETVQEAIHFFRLGVCRYAFPRQPADACQLSLETG